MPLVARAVVILILAACNPRDPYERPPECDAPPSVAPTWEEARRPIIVAHRGASAEAPENTMPAFTLGACVGAALETDVRVSRDGAYVLIHDPTTDRTTGVAGTVAEMSLAELRELNAAYLYPQMPVTRIPTLDEFLDGFLPENLAVFEVKAGGGTGVTNAIMATQHGRQVVLQSGSWSDLFEARWVDPSLRLQILSMEPLPVATLLELPVWGIGVFDTNVSPEYVADCHAAGINVMVWTVNSVPRAEALAAMGVDAIATDVPIALCDAVGACGGASEL